MNLFQVTKKQPSGGLELKTATGDIASFKTNYSEPLPAPFNSLNVKCSIVASGGGGTPAAPIPIVGHSELNLVRCGKNFIRDEFVSGLPSTNIGDDYDTITTSTRYAYLNLPNVNGNVTVSITDYDANYIDWVILFGYTNGKLSGKHQINNFSGSTVNLSGYDHLRIIIGAVSGYAVPSAISTVGKVQLELGSTATAYEPYHGTPYLVQFGQTVYGGVYDANRGKVRITHYYAEYDGTEDWYEGGGSTTYFALFNQPSSKSNTDLTQLCNIAIAGGNDYINFGKFRAQTNGAICIGNRKPDSTLNWADITAFKAYVALNHIQVCYELTTPIEIDVSALSVDTIVGTNNVFHDGNGDTEVKYLDVV